MPLNFPISLPGPLGRSELSDTTDDLTALRRYAATGDPRAFELVASRYQSMVLATCRRVLRSEADAEDAAQQAFIKLAAHAGGIRSNAAAWLHACAVRCATDLVRSGGAQRRAEAAVAVHGEASAADAGGAVAEWREIEPRLDAALGELEPAERDLIVGRFLAGRSQAEMARAAGVNPGTLHRRLDKALTKLQRSLRATGLAVTGTALAGALAHAVGESSPVLSAAVSRIGLAGMAHAKSGAAKTAITVVAGLALTVGVVGVGAVVLSSSGGSGGAGAYALATGGEAPDRPRRATKEHRLVASNTKPWGSGALMFDGRMLDFEIFENDPTPGRLVIEAVDIDERAKPPVIRGIVRTAETSPGPGTTTNLPPVGSEIEFKVRHDRIGRLRLTWMVDTPEGPMEAPWSGIRPLPGTPGFASVPADAGPLGLEGPWIQGNDWTLKIDKKDISIVVDQWHVHRFRIISWDKRGDHARVQVIAADSMDPVLIGERIKMLVREDRDGYTLAYHFHRSPRLNEWPRGFEASESNPVQVLRWAGGKP